MPKSKSDVEWRAYRAGNKYKKTDGGKWIIDTSNKLGSVRPIDLMSRDPDRLREFESKEAAVAFEEECYQDAERLKVAGADWSAYRYIPRKKLTIPEDQRRLHDSLAGEIRDGNRDVTEAVTEAVHARADTMKYWKGSTRARKRRRSSKQRTCKKSARSFTNGCRQWSRTCSPCLTSCR